LFGLTLNYSGGIYFEAFERANQEVFFQGHVNAFLFLGGIPLTITYDNLKSAVQAILKGNKRTENERFVAFRFEHYRKVLERKPGAQKHFRSSDPVVLPLKNREPGVSTLPEVNIQAPNMHVYSQL